MLRVMIAEDHDDLRVVLRNLVEGESDLVCVGAIGSAEQIVPLARDTRPDVLVLDLLLDAGSSLSVIRELRRETPKTRIILYSGYISDTVEREAHDRGAASCVSKGVPLERLLAEIRRQGLRGADGHTLIS